MSKRLVGEEYLRSILHAAISAEPACDGTIDYIDVFRSSGERANWDATLLAVPGKTISGDCKRAFFAAKSHAIDDYDLETTD